MSIDEYGSYSFETIGPGFVVFKIQTEDEYSLRPLLVKLKLARTYSVAPYRTAYEWTDDFKEFLKEQGYSSPLDVVAQLRKEGLVMSNAQAMIFRLRFL